MTAGNESTYTDWTADDVRHLLGRVEFTADEQRVDQLGNMSCAEAVDLLLKEAAEAPLPPPPDWVRDPWVNTERRYVDTTREEFGRKHGMTNRRYRQETADLRRWWFEQMVASPVPLREVMTLFWHGHFTSSIGSVLVSQAMFHQNETQRRLALGNFQELLRAMTLDAAMMIYLNLEDSHARSPNENFARELFELFTLGIGNYEQQDIVETARALSGWILDAPPGTPKPDRRTDPETNRRFTRDGLIPRLDPERHDDGVKTILGQRGRFGVDDVIRLTVRHPACGRFLANRLIDFFAADDPHGAVQERMAAQFVSTGGEIAAMLRVLLTSPEFYAPASRQKLVKSPVALLAGACRQLKAEVEFTSGLNRYTAALGQELFNPPNVKGWPGGRNWIGCGTLALRYHLPDLLLDSREPPGMEPIGRDRGRPVPVPKDPEERKAYLMRFSDDGESMQRSPRSSDRAIQVGISVDRLFPGGVPQSPDTLADTLLSRMLTFAPRPELRQAARDAAAGSAVNQRAIDVIRVILSSPDYQLA